MFSYASDGNWLQQRSLSSHYLVFCSLFVWPLFQYSLPLDLISREVFSQWMEIVRAVADRPVPEQTNAVDEEDRVDLPWWKCKKWALHILHRMFERSVSLKQRLNMLGNEVLKTLSKLERAGLIREWRRLHRILIICTLTLLLTCFYLVFSENLSAGF